MTTIQRFISFIFCLFLLCPLARSQELILLKDDLNSQTIGKKVIYYLDDSQKLSFREISSSENQAKFKQSNTDNPNFGFYGGNVWVKFRLKKNVLSSKNFVLEIPYPPLDTVEFYYQKQNKEWKNLLTGDRILYAQRSHPARNYWFPLDIRDTLEHTFYVRIRTKGSIQLPLLIYEENTHHSHQIVEERFYSFFFGVLFIMAFYNLFLFFPLKDLNYLLYFFSIFSTLITYGTLSGYSGQFFPNYSIWWCNTALPLSINLAAFFSLLFALYFLGLNKYARYLHIIFITILIFNGLSVFISLFADYNLSIILAVISILISSLLTIGSAVYVYAKGNRSARFFLAAWLVFLLGVVLIGLRTFGLMPNNFFTSYGVQFGSMMEVLLLSFALADKINLYRKETYQAQQETLKISLENERIIREQNASLEEKVQERTLELQEKQSEILAQNEELYQQQEEILAQRDFIEQKNKELQARDRLIQSSIQAASTIQQAILRYENELMKHFKEHLVIFKPRDVVSGDFYWLGELDDKIILAAVDCTGHGVPGAFMALIGNTLLDKIVLAWKIIEPAQILTRLHLEVKAMLRQSETGNQNGMDASVILLEKMDNQTKITFSGAKQSLYYWEYGAGNIQVKLGDRKSIGGIQNENRQFSNQTFTLPQNSLLYLGSDGFADQNDAKRKKFGELRFRELLSQIAPLSLAEQKTYLNKTFDEYVLHTTQRDDILLIGVQI